MSYIYSAKFNAFYTHIDLEEKEQIFRDNGLYPDDGVEVSDDVFIEYACTIPPDGKMRMPDSEGLPSWADIPGPSKDQIIYQAEQEKNARISSANAVFLEWQTKLLLNIATDGQKKAVTDWVNYLDEVKAIDTSTAPEIEWPDQPEVPK